MQRYDHQNMFCSGDKALVYAKLQKDSARDSRQSIWLQILYACVAIVGSVASGHYDWLWIFAALWVLEQSIWCFVDASNRNFAMHVIDWVENGEPTKAKP